MKPHNQIKMWTTSNNYYYYYYKEKQKKTKKQHLVSYQTKASFKLCTLYQDLHLPRKSFPLQTHFSLESTIYIILHLFLEVSFLHALLLSWCSSRSSKYCFTSIYIYIYIYILLASSWFLVFLSVFCQGFIYSCEVCIYAVISIGICLSCSSLQEFTDHTCSYQSLMYTCLCIYSAIYIWILSESISVLWTLHIIKFKHV